MQSRKSGKIYAGLSRIHGRNAFVAIVFMGITTISFIRGFRIGFEKVSKITHELIAGNLDVDMGEIKMTNLAD